MKLKTKIENHFDKALYDKIWGEVNFFFKNRKKTALWMRTANPLLGNISPFLMIAYGKGEKLLQFVLDAQKENK